MSDRVEENLSPFIDLERAVAKLYRLYCELFPCDKEFWWKISLEEENHAALLRSCIQFFNSDSIISVKNLQSQASEVACQVSQINEKVELYKRESPSPVDACSFALKIEQSAGEMHYQQFMSARSGSRVDAVLRSLNGDDIDHAERIKCLMRRRKLIHE